MCGPVIHSHTELNTGVQFIYIFVSWLTSQNILHYFLKDLEKTPGILRPGRGKLFPLTLSSHPFKHSVIIQSLNKLLLTLIFIIIIF